MDILTSLKVSFFGFLVVFVTLILISICIKILSSIIIYFEKAGKQKKEQSFLTNPAADNVESQHSLNNEDKEEIGYGELKLYNVDEKTAAMIMAIVSDESQIPLSELRFKSIKLL